MIDKIRNGAFGLVIVGGSDMKRIGAERGPQHLRTCQKTKGRDVLVVHHVDDLNRGWRADVVEQHEHTIFGDQPPGIGYRLTRLVGVVVGEEVNPAAMNASRGIDFFEPYFAAKGVLAAQEAGMASQGG